MQIQEQIYTSAAELLEGGGNLGVVAKTRGFPSELAPDLASLRSYTMLASLPIDQPEKHPARFVGGPKAGGTLYSVSRIAFGGFDHTGRTTPLAHHLVAAVSEMESGHIKPAQLVASADPMFVRRYSPPPRWIDPPREVGTSNDPDATIALKSLLSLIAVELIGSIPKIAGAVFAYVASRRPAIIVVDSSSVSDPLLLVRAILSTLPASVQRCTTWATHVVETTDYVRDAALVLTYSGTPFLEQCQFRRDGRAPVIFGAATAPSGEEIPAENTWAGIIGKDWPHQPGLVVEACRRWDELEMKPADMAKFGGALSLVAALDSAVPDQIRELGVKLSAGSNPPAIAKWIADSAERVVNHLAGSIDAVVDIACDVKWPLNSRAAALGHLLESAKTSSPPINQLSNRAKSSADLMKLIETLITRQPEIIGIVFNRAASTNSKEDIDAVEFLMTAGTIDMFLALELAEQASSFSPDLQRLSELLVDSIARAADSSQRLEMLVNSGATVRDRQFSRMITLPVLHKQLQSIKDPSRWSRAYRTFLKAAVEAKAVEEQARWLCQAFRKNLSPEYVDQWLSDSTITEADRAIIRREATNVGIDLKKLDEIATADELDGSAKATAFGGNADHAGLDSLDVVPEPNEYFEEPGPRSTFSHRAAPVLQGGSTAGLIWWTNIILALIAVFGVLIGLRPHINVTPPYLQLPRPSHKTVRAAAIVGGILLCWILSGPVTGVILRISGRHRVSSWVPLAVPFVLLAAVAVAFWSIY